MREETLQWESFRQTILKICNFRLSLDALFHPQLVSFLGQAIQKFQNVLSRTFREIEAIKGAATIRPLGGFAGSSKPGGLTRKKNGFQGDQEDVCQILFASDTSIRENWNLRSAGTHHRPEE
jgi:hypothetical protein